MASIATYGLPKCMTPEQRAFCDAVLAGATQSEAARKAYRVPKAQAGRKAQQVMRTKAVREYLARMQPLVEERVTLSAAQRKSFVINRLMEEADPAVSKDSEAKDRIKALELLGKVHDVRLFTDAVDAAQAVRTSAEIRAELLARLKRVLPEENPSEIKDITPAEDAGET